MLERLADLVLDNRAVTGVILALLFVGSLIGAKDLAVDFRVTTFFGGDDPAADYFEEFVEYWGADDDVLIVVVQADEGDLLEPDRLRRLVTLSEAIEGLDLVERVDSIATVPQMRGETLGLDLTPVIETLPTDEAEYREWRARLLEHPLYVPSLLSADGTVAALLIETEASSDDIRAVQPLVKALRDQLAIHEGQDGLHYLAAGIPAVRADFFAAFMSDQAKFVPLGMALIILCLFVVFRRMHGVVVPGLAAALPVAMVYGIMGWTGEDIGLLNQVYSTLLPAIAVADGIHLVSRFHEEARRRAAPGEVLTPEVRREAIRAAMSRIGAACFLTSLTTGIGFLSLQAAQMPVLRSFGLYAAVGIFLAYGTVLFVVPLLLSFTRGTVPEAGREDAPTPLDRLLLGSARFSTRRPGIVLGATAVVFAVSVFFGLRVQVDNHLTRMLQPEHETTRANAVADAQLGGILGLEIDVQGEPGILKDPAVLSGLLALEDWARELPQIRTTAGPASYLATMYEFSTGERRLPGTTAGAAQFFLMAEGDEALGRQLASDYSRGRTLLRVQDEGGIKFGELAARVQQKLDEELAGLPVTAHLTGTPYVAYRGINNVTGDLRTSLILAFVVIALVILVLLRNLRAALLSLLPNALPLVVGYGLLGMMGWLLDPAPAVVFTIALGIAVDDTLHLMVRTREELRAGRSMEAAIHHAVLHSGRAVSITSVILMAGFGVNMLSSFPATILLGALGSVVIGVAWACDLFVLPALLAAFGGDGSSALSAPKSLKAG
jgi:predicted RND superfamily exporter protein